MKRGRSANQRSQQTLVCTPVKIMGGEPLPYEGTAHPVCVSLMVVNDSLFFTGFMGAQFLRSHARKIIIVLKLNVMIEESEKKDFTTKIFRYEFSPSKRKAHKGH